MTMIVSPDAADCPIAENIAARVLTLLTYYDLALEDVKAIACSRAATGQMVSLWERGSRGVRTLPCIHNCATLPTDWNPREHWVV